MRQFSTGANRDDDTNKLDFEAALSPLVLKRYAEFIAANRKIKDGVIRADDNWQKLFGPEHYDVCMKSLWRHLEDMWLIHRGLPGEARSEMYEAMMGVMFNLQAYAYKWYLEHPET